MIVGELCSHFSFEKKYLLQKNLYNYLGKKYKKFYFINCYNINNKKKLQIDYSFYRKKNIIFFNPKNTSELKKFLSKNKIFLINNLSFKFEHFFFHFLVSKQNIFQISIDNMPIFSNYKTENWDHVNFSTKIGFLFRKKFQKLIYRIFIILRIINQIDILYVARKDLYKRYNLAYNKKSLLLKKYKNVEITSVRLPFFSKKKEPSNKYITFIDSNILHPDMLRRGHLIDNTKVKKYFIFLKNYLTKLRRLFKKEIIICLHPSSSHALYKKHLNSFRMYKYKTDKYILESILLLFHGSSSIFNAIILKKKIINLKSDIMGPFRNARRSFYLKRIRLVEHDIEKNIKIKKKNLITKLERNIKSYKKFITNYYYTKENSLPIEQIISNKIKEIYSEKTPK
jgi:hypothetical protein